MANQSENPIANPSSEPDEYIVCERYDKIAPNGKRPDEENDNRLPEGWEWRYSKEGRPYFADHNSRTTSWVKPKEKISYGSTSIEAITALPEGWEERHDEKKTPYYVDHNTRTTSWVRPLSKGDETAKPLPKGWERRRTKDGRLYYVNHNDKRTSWHAPENHEVDVQEGQVFETTLDEVDRQERLMEQSAVDSSQNLETKPTDLENLHT
ncbi:MAG: hypothetical protein Q9220_005442 [cf. Caloplaca sp. 1 TL-2023]